MARSCQTLLPSERASMWQNVDAAAFVPQNFTRCRSVESANAWSYRMDSTWSGTRGRIDARVPNARTRKSLETATAAATRNENWKLSVLIWASGNVGVCKYSFLRAFHNGISRGASYDAWDHSDHHSYPSADRGNTVLAVQQRLGVWPLWHHRRVACGRSDLAVTGPYLTLATPETKSAGTCRRFFSCIEAVRINNQRSRQTTTADIRHGRRRHWTEGRFASDRKLLLPLHVVWEVTGGNHLDQGTSRPLDAICPIRLCGSRTTNRLDHDGRPHRGQIKEIQSCIKAGFRRFDTIGLLAGINRGPSLVKA